MIVGEHFPKISEDFWRCPQISEDPKTFDDDPKMFWSYTNKLKNNLRDKLYTSEIIDILTSENMESTPLKSRM